MLSDRRPIVCLVTDRRRLCPACDEAAALRCVIAQVGHAVEAGVDLVQIRERGIETKSLAALVGDAVAVARGSFTRVIVNDRLDVALACGAGGVHLPADSIAACEARRMSPPGFLIGRSVHGADEAARLAADVDYLLAGTVFATAAKPAAERLLGEAGLAATTGAANVPVLAIGGVTIDRVPRVAASGAAGFAAIGMFLGGESGAPCRSGALDAVVRAARLRFDTVKTAP